MRVAITGASGFVGSALQEIFNSVSVIERDDSEDEILQKLEDIDVVINLAGAPIIKRWSDEYKKTLYDSRVLGTRKLVNAINRSNIEYFISTSAIGIYPDVKVCDESCSEKADDFLARLATDWEAEALKCEKKTAILRMGIILGKNGGALKHMLIPFSLGVGGILANAKTMMSWIDIADLMRIYKFLIEHRSIGVFNAVSPNPVTNYVFTKSLGKTLHRPTWFFIPEFILKLIFGEGSIVLTGSKEVYPARLLKEGFEFKYGQIESSLKHLIH